ncbi:unnamed protein product [Spirodela intermedia]|uniref:Uncharacterized protein n=2 Tax=Spirodela intermedia TaxID=51605 RepID=A0A7I8IJ46_SPIIN|nr:unnamed protein product [Spirodela intermedia]CAA6657176.1 unnamed protein product [Spirodela intermedia]CAA6675730.1 unnamed protein product [Spirodela intermedia]CAA7393193.1 unnamed protein product [Spirodela intermedia]
MIETKAIEYKMFLEKFDKLTKDIKILMDSYENVEIECPRHERLLAINDRLERTPQPPAYIAHYNNYNNYNYKRESGNTYQPSFLPQTTQNFQQQAPFQPILCPQNFQSIQATHLAQNEATLATNELLKQMM